MAFTSIIKRLLLGTRMQSTETVQRQILAVLDGLGTVSAETLYQRIDSDAGAAQTQMMVDQAAQILVNTRIVIATKDKITIDPIHAGGNYQLAYPPIGSSHEKDNSR